MIKKIKKIKDLGIFKDFVWATQQPDFERYNLIYGWNGCGKTTLSRLFATLDKGSNAEFPTLRYEIVTDSGNYSEGFEYAVKIKVFNEDYVTNNIELISGKAKPIFILGEENKLIAAQISEDEGALKSLLADKKSQEDLKTVTERAKGNKFTDIARVIGSNSAGSSVRTYRKNNAEVAFAKLPAKHQLRDDEVAKLTTALKQEPKRLLTAISIDHPDDPALTVFDSIKESYTTAKTLAAKTVESTVLERLVDNPDISEWVEKGLVLHKLHKSPTCEFCGNEFSESRVGQLALHFNEADQEIKSEVDRVVNSLDRNLKIIQSIQDLDAANFYAEQQKDYTLVQERLANQKGILETELQHLKEQVKSKKQKTTEYLEVDECPDFTPLEDSIKSINEFISANNKVTNNFEEEKRLAQEKIEKHYLSEIYDDVKDLESELEAIDLKLSKIKDGDPNDSNVPGIDSLRGRIKANRARINSEEKACDVLNKQVATFLGHDELQFEVVSEGGYLIKRNGKLAKNLSEGEKTAIAFVYFVVHLQDQNFDIKDGIVVIDDPISSLDSNSLFQAFAFLQNAVRDAKQVFILTHNFEFMRLLLGWFNHIKNKVGKKRFLMITNKYSSEQGRTGNLVELDPMLKDYETEYQYLFKKLYKFKSDGTIENVYHIPNLARKTLETFLMFRVPNGKSLHAKLEELDFDEVKKAAIYKFTNDQSHLTGGGFDPSIVLETQNNVGHILEMIKTVSPEHFNIIEAAITSTEPMNP